MSVARDYVDSIMYRRVKPLEPVTFKTNWADQPRRHKVYPDVVRLPLATQIYRPSGDIHGAMTDPAVSQPDGSPTAGRLTLAMLGALLHDSYAPLERRLSIHSNAEIKSLPWYSNAAWSRGVSSGGGLYPLEFYWVSGPSGPFLPGVYHYCTPHHALDRLLTGDVVGRVRDALHDDEVAASTDQYLLISVKFWKNAFKYNTFSYHAVTVDLGTTLSTWQYWCQAAGVALRPVLWFDEPSLNDLLGLQTRSESVLAVVPLPFAGTGPATRQATGGEPVAEPVVAGEPANPAGRPGAGVWLREVERSREILRFPAAEAVHAATVPVTWPRPVAAALRGASPAVPAHDEAEWTPLPPPGRLPGDVPGALRARRSSFGRLSAHPSMSRAELGTVLATSAAGGRLRSDVKNPDGTPSLTRMVAFVNHVNDLAPGSYDYDPGRHALALREQGNLGTFLQQNYFLTNYNLEQVAAVLTVVARPGTVIDAIGDRGYRVVNAEIGAVTQAVYLACAALGLGCGAALGIDSLSYAERLDLVGTDEWPVLIMMVGHDRPGGASFDCPIT